MASDNKYSIEMIWSGLDGIYLSQVRELPGCIADGATPEEALQNIMTVMQEWLDTAKEEGREIPTPMSLELMEQKANEARNALRHQLENRVREAVMQLMENFKPQEANENIPAWRERVFPGFEHKLEKTR